MKNSLFVLLICSLPLFSLAQEEETSAPADDRTFSLGLTVSPTLGWFSSPPNSNRVAAGPRMGFSYGLLGDFKFAKNYFFATGFLLTGINGKTKTESETSSTSDKYRLQYIEVPLSLKLKSNESGLGRFYGQFGLSSGIKVKSIRTYGGVATGTNDNVNFASQTNLFRIGLIAGGGAEWNIGRNLSLLTGLSFNNGFTNAFKNDDERSSFVSLNIGVFF